MFAQINPDVQLTCSVSTAVPSRFKLLPVMAELLTLQLGSNPVWAAEECGPVPPGIEPSVTCTARADPYSGGISYLEPEIPFGVRLTVKNDVFIAPTPADARHGVDVATNGANSIYVYLEDGARVDVSGAEA